MPTTSDPNPVADLRAHLREFARLERMRDDAERQHVQALIRIDRISRGGSGPTSPAIRPDVDGLLARARSDLHRVYDAFREGHLALHPKLLASARAVVDDVGSHKPCTE